MIIISMITIIVTWREVWQALSSFPPSQQHATPEMDIDDKSDHHHHDDDRDHNCDGDHNGDDGDHYHDHDDNYFLTSACNAWDDH